MTDATMGQIATTGEFRIGDALNRSVRLLGRHAVPFLVISALGHLPELYSLSMTIGPARPDVLATHLGSLSLAMGGNFLLALLWQGSIIVIAVGTEFGRPVPIDRAVSQCLGRFWAALGTSLLAGLIVGLLCLLLIVPGLMALIAIIAAFPACIIEGSGPTASLKRSRMLTKGHRWKIFGLILLIGLPSAAINFGLTRQSVGLVGHDLALATIYGWTVLVGAFGAVLNAMIFVGLRTAKDGPGEERLAAVFD